MAFDDSLIGSNDFDPRAATEDLIRRTSDEPLPATLDPRALNTRLARKLGREPSVTAPSQTTIPEPKKQSDLDFSSQAAPASNMEPGGKDALDFTSQVTPQAPMPPQQGILDANLKGAIKGLPTGLTEGIGGVMQGVATATPQMVTPQTQATAIPLLDDLEKSGSATMAQRAQLMGRAIKELPNKALQSDFNAAVARIGAGADPKAETDKLRQLYAGGYQQQTQQVADQLKAAGKTVSDFHPNMTPQERDSIGGRVTTMAGGIAPYAAAAVLGGPALGAAAGFAGMAADTYGKVYEDAKSKGADDVTAAAAAKKGATAAGILGALPLGTGKLASSIVGKIVSQGLTFAGTNEATEYVLQEIAKDYDQKAGYTPEAKRIIASLITGGLMGGLHAFERKPEDVHQGTSTDTSGREAPAGALPGGEQAPNGAQAGPDNGTADSTGAGPQPGPQGGPQPGGARAKPNEQAKPGEAPKGEGEEVPDDHTVDPKMRAKMERVYRTFDPKGDPSKMTDAELFRAVNEHLRDTSSSGYTAKGDTVEEKAQREQHATKQAEDADLKKAFAWMTDAQIQSMTPDMRAVWLNRARGAKPGEQARPRDEAADADARKAGFQSADEVGPDDYAPVRGEHNAEFDDGDMARGETPVVEKTGRREAPIAARTADDVLAAQPVEPKSAAQAEAENYQHAHMELEHLGLKGQHSISVETGVGQTRKGPPGPDGEPEWQVKMEQGAYGRIKGTKGADGQPLDIMVGPHPTSPHVFIINQHDPATGKFDELKIQAGYRTPLDAMHAYAISYNDHAQGRIGGMVAMTAEQFHAWLKHGDHTKAVQHGDANAVLARAFPEAGASGKTSAVSREGGVASTIATSGGLHNAPEVARRPLTEAPAETSSPDVPKGSQEGDAKEATSRPALTTHEHLGRSKAPGENLSLLEFLADRGGIAPHPELEAIGFGGMHRVQIPGRKGFFGLIKKGGWDLDTAREAAEEAGYLQGDHPDATSTIRHLLDAMDAEVRGTKLYPFQGEGQRTKTEQRLDTEREEHERARAQELIDELDEAGHGELGPELKAKTLQFMAQGMDPDTAVDHAMAALDAEEAELTQREIDDTYGEGAYDEVLAGIPYEGGPDGSREGAEGDRSETGPPEQSGEHAPQARAADRESGVAGREEAGRGEGSGEPAEAGEGEPVRQPARAKQRATGRKQAVGDEAGNAARHQPAAENADHAEGGIAGKVADEAKAHGRNARRRGKDDPLSKYLKVNRPKNADGEGWISYRTETTLAYNTAHDDGAPKEVLDALKTEVDAANAYLQKHKPEVWERLTRPEPTTETGADNSDGFGTMEHFARGEMPFKTKYTPEGYYWQHINGPWIGPFKSREEAKAAELSRTEKGADGKPQIVLPGAEKASDKTMAQRGAEAPLKPKANQKPADDGLFGDGHKQTDLLDMVNAKPKTVKTASLPKDMQVLIGQFVTDHNPDGKVPADLPLTIVKVSELPKVPLNEDDRGEAHAREMDLSKTPPILIADGKLLDGRHRAFIAREQGAKTLPAIDLTGIAHPKSIADNHMGRIGAPPKDEFDDIFDAAVNEQFAKPVSLDQATEGLKAIFGKKPAGLAESEAPFSDDTYAQALPYLKAGVANFASAGDLPLMVRALVSHLANAGMDADAIRAMKPYIRRFTDDVRSGKETLNAPSRREVLERDRANAAPENGVGAADVSAAAGGAGPSAGARGGATDAGDQRPASRERVPQDYAPVVGERGNLEIPEREPVADDSDAAAPEPERSGAGGQEGFSFDQRTDDEAEADAQRAADLNGRRKAQAEADAKAIPLKQGDLANIAATLPMLFPEQHEDVRAAEERFAKADGHGMLFTNGTGTGKTYSGLGIIKRFALAGKKQAIVIAPSQGILMDWQRSAKDLGLDAHILDSIVDKGRPGLNLTTYANFGENPTLADQEWDIVVPDEAHKLSSDQDGTTTKALRTLRALTYHPDGLPRRAEMVFRKEFEQIRPLPKEPTAEESAAHSAAVAAYNAKAGPAVKEWRARKRTNKAAFLSATPFAYHFSLDWAEGYLFNFPEDTNSGAYNAPTGRDSFYMQHLGYRKKTGKLTKPDAEVKQEVMERQLHEYLRKTGSLAGRMLTVDKDYDRKFILAHDAIGNQIDQALNFLQDNEQFRPLVDYVSKKFDYLTRMRLLEAIKARAAIDYINQSIALGRKVVVFHDYNEGGGINPFELEFNDKDKVPVYRGGKIEDVELKPLYDDFVRQNPYVKELKFSDYPAPIATLTAAFPKALVYNGTVSKKKRDQAKALFNDDNSGHDLIIVQSAAGEAGISLHDTTGKHQRVTLNLGMPIRPVSSIQQEGRIYRVGQASDAMFRYMNTGTDWERWTFAGKIADRAGTAENLALGNQARTIRQSFIDAFANAEDYRPEQGEGTGGKAADRAVTHSMTEFEKAKTHYYAQAKVSGRRDQREGTDYYATAEPIGFKMVEWSNVKSGEKMLEPSAGHGAIARYFPEDTHRTLVEPSSSLASRASLNSTGARVVVDRFENLDPGANKQDVIVMNPPFGHGGKTAFDHLTKAAKHLRNGGRIVALVPRGANADKNFEEFYAGPKAKDLQLVGTVELPPVAFERAGTAIRTRIMVLEKQTDPEIRNQLVSKNYDISNAETVGEMFDRIEHLEMPPRLEPKTKDVEAPAQGNITVNGIELKMEDDADRAKKGGYDPTFYATPKNKFRDRFRDVVGYAEKAGGKYANGAFEFKTTEARQVFVDMIANPPKAPDKPSGVTFKKGETLHGKTGAKVFVASPEQRVERSIYDQMNAAAKAAGGYWSSFTKGNAIPGFQFPSEGARAQFLKAMGLKEAPQRDPFAPAGNFSRYEGHPGKGAGARAQQFTLERGRATGNEQLVVFGAGGKLIGDIEGGPTNITFTPEIESAILDPAQDIVLHHNHPRNRSFSATDIAVLAGPGVRTIWAHGHGGGIYRVNLTPEARAKFPSDPMGARASMTKLANYWYTVQKGLNAAFQTHWYQNGQNKDFEAAYQAAAAHLNNEVLRNAGLIEYETNFETDEAAFGDFNLRKLIQTTADAIRKDLFGAKGPSAAGRLDRRPESVRHPGNVGVSFDRAEVAATVNPGGRSAPPRGGNGLREAERGDALPGLEEIDKTFNDLLGRRLLGKLGDLNATEMRTQLQDKFARVRNVEEEKGNRDTALSAYQAESLYYGRTGQRLESLKEHVVDPIIREMKGRDISLDMMDKFLYARHAPERNNVVGALYPDSHDFKKATRDPRIKGASGMSTNEANSFIGRLRTDGKLADYQAVGRMVDALNFRTRQTLLNAGLIDRATFDALNSQYRYYVPLRGWQEGSNEDTLPHQSKGMDTRAKAFKQAFGRQTIAASPLAYSIMQAEQAVVKAEKNKVGNTFLRFARANPDPDLWTINRPEPRKYVSKVTGMVHSSPTWDMNDEKTFITRVDGKAVLVQFKGEDGGNLARALKNMGSANVHTAIRMLAAVTHTMARLATAWNPEFMIPNLVRDVGEAFINLGEQRQRTFVRKFAAHILPAMKGSWQAIAEKNPGDPYVDAFHEFDREGGRVRFFGLDDPDAIEKNVEKRLKRLSGGVINSIKDMGDKAGKALEIMGGGIENATRLAAYMAAKDVGMSAPDAAMLARNLTVNFNKKGELGTAIGSLYMFANAGIQGQARMLRALHPKNRRVWMAVGALAASGVMSTSFNLGIGGYDQAGVANYMKIPSWERDKNIIIMGPGETYGKIPLPYGFAPFHVLGSHAATVVMGQEKPTAAAAAVLGSIASAFNPLGEEDSAIATLVPTTLRPAYHITTNTNWTGKPVYPARDSDKGKPNSQQSFRTDTAASKAVAEGLNTATGGDRYHPGVVDLHPGSLDHVMGAITGGVGKFFKNIVDTVVNGWNGQPWEASKTPIIRRFVGKIDHAMADSAAYYDARKEATEEANRTRQAKRDIKTGADEQAARAFLDATPAGRQKLIFDRADQQMRRLRAEEERINNSAQPYEAKRAALDAVRQQMREVQNRARTESSRLKQGSDRLYVSPNRGQQ